LKKAKTRGGMYKKFSDGVQKAMASAEIRDVLIIGEASKTQWQASAWRLERKFPKRWGRFEKIEATIDGQMGVSFEGKRKLIEYASGEEVDHALKQYEEDQRRQEEEELERNDGE
ncbi:hypothetical protein HWQ67_18640, partial [Candidatus Magnetobacterium casensis]